MLAAIKDLGARLGEIRSDCAWIRQVLNDHLKGRRGTLPRIVRHIQHRYPDERQVFEVAWTPDGLVVAINGEEVQSPPGYVREFADSKTPLARRTG